MNKNYKIRKTKKKKKWQMIDKNNKPTINLLKNTRDMEISVLKKHPHHLIMV